MESLVVIVYLIFVLLIGLWAGRGIKTMHDYAWQENPLARW